MKLLKGKRRILASINLIGLLLATLVPIGKGLAAPTSLRAPEVICVPWKDPEDPHGSWKPHETWNGNEVVLKGIVRSDSTNLAYEWDFGDGSPPSTGDVTDKYAISARHVYPDSPTGTVFNATLTVTDRDTGMSGSDTYTVKVRDRMLPVQVNVAIDNGLWYLHTTMERYEETGGVEVGYWPGYTYDVGYAGMAVLAFEIQGHLLTENEDEDPYVETVRRGLNFLLDNTYSEAITAQPAGDPDTNGNGKGLVCSTGEGELLYEAGIAAMALADSGDSTQVAEIGPADVLGRSYFGIVQDMVDWLAYAQNEDDTSGGRGGWRYGPNHSESDMSVTQWPVLGLEAAWRNWGIAVPKWVKDELRDHFLLYIQDTDGGFGYTDPTDKNIARTGAGLVCLVFTEVSRGDSRVNSAIQYVADHWEDDNIGNLYAMYGVMKGSLLFPKEGDRITFYGSHDWYKEYASYLVSTQFPDGHWLDPVDWGGEPIDTAWAILILSPTVFVDGRPSPPEIPETSALVLVSSGLAALAGYIGLQFRTRRRE